MSPLLDDFSEFVGDVQFALKRGHFGVIFSHWISLL
jgi:hypothetical protein